MKHSLLSILLAIVVSLSLFGSARAQENTTLEGTVFLDTNGDGERQADEPGIGGVTVQATTPANPLPYWLVTDALGAYRVEDPAPGTYQVTAEPPAGYVCVRCQVEIEVTAAATGTADLALALAPTTTPTPTPTFTPAPTATPGRPVITFYASPDTIYSPNCTTLFWRVDRATEVFLILPGGQYGVEGGGQQEVCPQTTTAYRLKVNGADGSQEIVEAQVLVLPPPTSTPAPTPRPPKPKPLPTSTPAPTFTPTPEIVATATLTPTLAPTLTPTPTALPSPTATPAIDPLLAGLPVRWGTFHLAGPEGE
jgi:hypothetical protein